MIREARKTAPTYIVYEKAADKFFKVHEDLRTQYEEAVKEFYNGEHPERIDVKTLRGKKGEYYRLRLGKWRVLYTTIEDTIFVINTLMAGSRGDIYKRLGGLRSIL